MGNRASGGTHLNNKVATVPPAQYPASPAAWMGRAANFIATADNPRRQAAGMNPDRERSVSGADSYNDKVRPVASPDTSPGLPGNGLPPEYG